MDKEAIAKRVHELVTGELKDIPFDKGLPKLRKLLWSIADEYGVKGADIFGIYMDWLSSKKD